MKHIKLFEQFEDDPFGEEEHHLYDSTKLYFIKYNFGSAGSLSRTSDGGNKFYLGWVDNGTIHYFHNYTHTCRLSEGWSICDKNTIDWNDTILIFDNMNKYSGAFNEISYWKFYKYGTLPQEIKDQIQ